MTESSASKPDELWRRAFTIRGLVARKVREAIDAADGERVELPSPRTQPFRRNMVRVVNAQAARKWGAGNYRLQSLSDPPRVAVWPGPSMSGVPAGSTMSRQSLASVREYMERRLNLVR